MVTFDESGHDSTTFPPLRLTDVRTESRRLRLQGWGSEVTDSEWSRRISFDQLDRLLDGEEYVEDDYYLNGYGVLGLFQAQLLQHGEPLEAEGESLDAEGDGFYAYFTDPDRAEAVAARFSAALRDREAVEELARIARQNGLGD
jgi:hypothetical protein